jgi:DNA-binding transcriptional ArsR family regulator
VDIKQALIRRLALLQAERRRIQSRLSVIEEVERELKSLLDIAEQPSLSLPNIDDVDKLHVEELINEREKGPALKEFLQKQLKTGPQSLEQLVVAIRESGFDFGTKSAARTIHFHLLNLKNSGLVEKDGDNWKMRDREALLAKLAARKP